jgi:urease accessory protein
MNLLVWQLIDSGFPSGGFAHSAGLEASVQHGHVYDGDSVRAFATQAIAQCGRGALPLVTAAHQRPEDFADLDRLADVFLSNPVANRASRAQGRALLTSVARSFPDTAFTAVDATLRSERLAAHYAPVFGRLFALLGVELADTQRSFLFIAVRGVTSAAVRLGIIGAYEAQTLQSEMVAHVDTVIGKYGRVAPHELAQSAPLIDLFQSTQDRLYSRLFQS